MRWESLGGYFNAGRLRPPGATLEMTYTLEISEDLRRRLDDHLEEDETYEEFIEELVSVYETEGAFLQEGYSE